MESQNGNKFKKGLTKEFFNLDKVNRQLFLRYLVTMPDLEEKKDIEIFLDNMYIDNNDKGDKMAEDLLKRILTLEKDQKMIFVEYLTNHLNDEDSAFVFSLLGSRKADGIIAEDMELEENEGKNNSCLNQVVDDSEIDLKEGRKETTYLKFNDVEEDIAEDMKIERTGEINNLEPGKIIDNTEIAHNVDTSTVDPKEVCLEENYNDIQNNSVSENYFESELKNLIAQFFKLNKVNRQKFLRYLVTVPDLVEKKDIESYLDDMYLDNNDLGGEIVEDLFKMVLNLEKEKKLTLVKRLTSRLNDDDAAFVFSLLGNLKENENTAEDLELEENGETFDSHLNKTVDDSELLSKEETSESKLYEVSSRGADKDISEDMEIDRTGEKNDFHLNEVVCNSEMDPKEGNIVKYFNYFHNNGVYENYFENDTLLIKMTPKLPEGLKPNINIKRDVEHKTNATNFDEHKINKTNAKIIYTESNVEHKIISNNLKKEKEYIKVGRDHSNKIYIKSEKKEDSKYFENDVLLIKVKLKLPSGVQDKINTSDVDPILHTKNNYEVDSNSGGDYKYMPIKNGRAPKQEIVEDSKQNIVSTFARKQYTCKMCDKHFSGQPGLYYHTKSVHEGVRYPCDKCKYKALCRSDLQKHVKSIHEGVRYPCDQCNYTAGDKSNLTQHMKVIHGGVQYPCDQTECDYQTRDKYSLAKHKNAIHKGVRYPCGECEYKGTQKSNLTSHQLRYHI